MHSKFCVDIEHLFKVLLLRPLETWSCLLTSSLFFSYIAVYVRLGSDVKFITHLFFIFRLHILRSVQALGIARSICGRQMSQFQKVTLYQQRREKPLVKQRNLSRRYFICIYKFIYRGLIIFGVTFN